MKSKSFELPKSSAEKVKQKTYDFVNFYKSDSEVKLIDKRKSDEGSSNENVISNKLHTPKRAAYKKNKKPQNNSVNISKINIDGDSLACDAESTVLDNSKVTSTPKIVNKDVKSIIKNKSLLENSMEVPDESVSHKPKKRNKSVSFMLDDSEGVVIKRTKSEEIVSKPDKISKRKKSKSSKKKGQDEKENVESTSNTVIDFVPTSDISMSNVNINNNIESTSNANETKEKREKKKQKKFKKAKPDTVEGEEPVHLKSEGEESKMKKIKKKKRHITPAVSDTDVTEAEGEPAQKSSKKDVKPDKIVHDLENLNIGDSPHTLTNLLDEMTVVDKNKKKKQKDKGKKQKKDKPTSTTSTNNDGDSIQKKKGKDKKRKTNNSVDTNIEAEDTEEKEKVKWVKRKWNKDKKGEANLDRHLTSVIIENLPLKTIFTYKKLLADHFEKFGLIKQVGIAEMYPMEDPKPVFSTTINFYSEDSAEKALEDDNTLFEGARIRVKRPLAPTLTTVVVRTYAELTEQALSSVFSAAGRIRSIRLLIKGRKSGATAFIEFDGPKSVVRAIQMAEDAKIGGKKIHAAKFELRASNKKQYKTDEHNENTDDSN
ncbi:uncharacterized protein LOC112046733 [Bicyclus anynana]|uniref:Uncharacterized protein LOC112046733 n=1 Tax=Bicyclus anynana TaxID=110368 RepID=A0A6J1N2C0_BICAN|nr:uncharacterized protein LOC112046733 [Bicyclus anynana]